MTAEKYRPIACGGLAGAISRICTSPLDVLKIRYQVQRYSPIRKYTSIHDAIRTIIREEGIKGLWKGTTPGILYYVAYTSIQFMTYDSLPQNITALVRGGIAASTATLLTYPLDFLRTRMTMQKELNSIHSVVDGVLRFEGIRAFYRGFLSTMLQVVPGMAITFATHNELKKHMSTASSGAISGIISKTIVMPFDVLRKRFQVNWAHQKFVSEYARLDSRIILQELKNIYLKEGIRGLWAGWVMAITKAAPVVAINFAVYEACQSALSAK